jgi:hypothetical protein
MAINNHEAKAHDAACIVEGKEQNSNMPLPYHMDKENNTIRGD